MELADTPDLGSGGEIRGVQVPPAAPKIMTKLLFKSILYLFFYFFIINISSSENTLDYSFHFIVDSCQVTKKDL